MRQALLVSKRRSPNFRRRSKISESQGTFLARTLCPALDRWLIYRIFPPRPRRLCCWPASCDEMREARCLVAAFERSVRERVTKVRFGPDTLAFTRCGLHLVR